jgi:hypothetical protein
MCIEHRNDVTVIMSVCLHLPSLKNRRPIRFGPYETEGDLSGTVRTLTSVSAVAVERCLVEGSLLTFCIVTHILLFRQM